MSADNGLSPEQRRGIRSEVSFQLFWKGGPMNRFALFVGGHANGGATMDWDHLEGSFLSIDDAKKRVPNGAYYALMDCQEGITVECGHRDRDGEFHPVKDDIE